MKRRINQRKEELQKQEKRILLELESSEDNLRSKTKSVGKIALVGGLIALLFYWVFKVFSDSNSESPKKKKKKKKASWNNTIGQLVTPYLVKFLNEILELERSDSDQKSDTD